MIFKNRLLVMLLARRTARPTQFRSRSSTPWAANKSRTIAPWTTISQMAEQTSPRLFISYSHDSREHEDRVRALADRLREDGVDAVVDQYNTAPPDGWPMWMDREIRKADFIALVCTETYLRRVEGREEPGKGRVCSLGSQAHLQLSVPGGYGCSKVYPDPIARWSAILIPFPLRGLTYYQANIEAGYEDFYRQVTGQPRHGKPALGKLKALPAIATKLPGSLEVRTERKPPTSLDQRNRLQMLKRVRMDWIDGVLNQSLYKVARIELGLQARPGATEQPLNAVVQVPDRAPTAVPVGMAISQVFDDYAGALLILGAQGQARPHSCSNWQRNSSTVPSKVRIIPYPWSSIFPRGLSGASRWQNAGR